MAIQRDRSSICRRARPPRGWSAYGASGLSRARLSRIGSLVAAGPMTADAAPSARYAIETVRIALDRRAQLLLERGVALPDTQAPREGRPASELVVRFSASALCRIQVAACRSASRSREEAGGVWRCRLR